MFTLVFVFLSVTTAYADLEKELVKIGVIIPLSGAHSIYGQDAKILTSLIADDLSEASKKYKYEFILEDGNCGVGNNASTATKKLVNINRVGFIIYGCSGEILQGGPIASKAKVVSIAFAASHPDVSVLGEYIFRSYVDIRKGTKLIEELLRKETAGKIGIITEESSFTSAIRDVLIDQLKGREVITADYAIDETDFKAGLLKFKAAGVKGIYINPNSPRVYINVVRQINELGIKIPLYSYFAPGDRDALESLGKLQDGVKYIDVYDEDASSKEYQVMYSEFLRTHPEGPQIPFMLKTAYNAILGLVTAIEAVGPTPDKVKDQMLVGTFPGAVGPTKFDKNREIEGLKFQVRIIKGGKPVSLP